MRIDFKLRAIVGAVAAGAIVAFAAFTMPGSPVAQGQTPPCGSTATPGVIVTTCTPTSTSTATATGVANTPIPTITAVPTSTRVPNTAVPSTATAVPTAVTVVIQPPATGDAGLAD